jgi:thymidylate synthase
MQNKDVKNKDAFITKELTCYTFMILDGRDRDVMIRYFKIPKAYVEQEWKDRISGLENHGVNPGEAWKLMPKLWKQYLNKDGTFDYTYSERFYEWRQPLNVRDELLKHPNSRQGVVAVYNQAHDSRNIGKKRIPCSMYYQFLIREGKVNIIYTMRSCDFLNHLGADVWLTFEFQKWMAHELKREVGMLTMFIGSLHIYKRYMKKKGVF